MLKEYPKFKKGEVENIYKKLKKAQKDELNEILLYRESNGLKGRELKDLRRYLIHQYKIIGDTIKKGVLSDTDAMKLSLVITNSHYSKEVRANLLINIANTLRHIHKDWTMRFNGLEMFNRKQLKKGEGSEPKEYDLLSDNDIKKIYRAENTTYWKAFFKTAEQTGGRTIEIRTAQNKKIEFNEDGTATIEIYMTKTGKKKFVFVDNETAELIKKLQEEQKNTEQHGKYLFNSPTDKDTPISKNQVCYWFRNLTLKAIGRKCQPYQLRHRRATILYKLAKENKISKDTTMELLGHGKDMSERYTHISEEERKRILKEQAFKLEMPEEKKHKLELEIESLKKQMNGIKELLISNATGNTTISSNEKERIEKAVTNIIK